MEIAGMFTTVLSSLAQSDTFRLQETANNVFLVTNGTPPYANLRTGEQVSFGGSTMVMKVRLDKVNEAGEAVFIQDV